MRIPPFPRHLLAVAVLASTATLCFGATIPTHVTLITARPDPSARDEQVLLVPGTVIPLPASSSRSSVIDQAPPTADTRRNAELIAIGDKLSETLRLSRFDIVWARSATFTRDTPVVLGGPSSSSDIRIVATAIGITQRAATYRVRIEQAGTVIADTPVTIARGSRAVVGGLDGPEAPYLFLVLEPAGTDAITVEGDLVPPRLIGGIEAEYTSEARDARLQGMVIIEALVAANGAVEDATVLKGLPMGLGESALAAVRKARFEPAVLDGEPVASKFVVQVLFRME